MFRTSFITDLEAIAIMIVVLLLCTLLTAS